MIDRNKAAIEALLSYGQADMDGIMVLTSRQAIHEVVDYIETLEAERDELRNIVRLWAEEFGLAMPEVALLEETH